MGGKRALDDVILRVEGGVGRESTVGAAGSESGAVCAQESYLCRGLKNNSLLLLLLQCGLLTAGVTFATAVTRCLHT